MTARTIKLLHVEDDESQRRLTAHHLKTMKEFAFTITPVESEDLALTEFQKGMEFVVLDYHLTQGNGLSCLRRLRQIDPVVPIIAVSGAATPEIAAELLQAGADDYISKQDLFSDTLARSVRQALARADAWRQRAPAGTADAAKIDTLFREICDYYLARMGSEFLGMLDHFERTARGAKVTVGQMQRLYETISSEFEAMKPPGKSKDRQLLRPVLLEILLRLLGESPNGRE